MKRITLACLSVIPTGLLVVMMLANSAHRVGAVNLATPTDLPRMSTCEPDTSIESAALSPDGKYLLAGWNVDTARLWNTLTGAIQYTFTGYSKDATYKNIWSVAFSPDGKYALLGN